MNFNTPLEMAGEKVSEHEYRLTEIIEDEDKEKSFK